MAWAETASLLVGNFRMIFLQRDLAREVLRRLSIDSPELILWNAYCASLSNCSALAIGHSVEHLRGSIYSRTEEIFSLAGFRTYSYPPPSSLGRPPALVPTINKGPTNRDRFSHAWLANRMEDLTILSWRVDGPRSCDKDSAQVACYILFRRLRSENTIV